MRNWRLPQKPSLRSRSGFWDFSADGSRRREKKAAKILENRITEELEDLNFLHVEFRVDVHRTDHFTAAGSDEVEFLISTNPGSIPPRPLGEVASGGELSRIMLAIKTVLADTDDIQL